MMIGDVTLKKSSSEGNLDQIDFFLEKNGPKVDKIVIMTIGNILRSDPLPLVMLSCKVRR